MRVKQLALCVFILAMIAGVAGAQTPPTCPVTKTVIVHATIVVSGTTFNGGCTRYVAGPELGDGSQSESQKPVFKGVKRTLRDVVHGARAADGIPTGGNV